MSGDADLQVDELMPFDQEKWHAAAKQGDIGGAYLDLSISLRRIVSALNKIEQKTGVDISKESSELEDMRKEYFDKFVEYTGWVGK